MNAARRHNPAIVDLEAWSAGDGDPMRPLPSSMYTCEAQLQLEIEQVFEKEWVCVGHASQLQKPGDYLTFRIVDKPILVVRGRDGGLRAFANVCRHRGTVIARDSGNRRTFTCPYHAWTYDLDGCLQAAPFMDEAETQGICLPEYRLEDWHGLLFVNLDDAAAPLAPRLAGLAERFQPYRMDGFHLAFRNAGEIACNWKVLVENFCESYHLFQVHKKTLEPDSPTRTHEMQPGGEGFNDHIGRFVNPHSYENAPPHISAELRDTYHISCIYPCTAMNVDAQTLFWITVQPTAAQSCRYDLWFTNWTKNPKRDCSPAAAQEIQAFVTEFMSEDKAVIQRVQKGLAADSGHRGPLNKWERSNWEFGHYLARRLLNSNSGR